MIWRETSKTGLLTFIVECRTADARVLPGIVSRQAFCNGFTLENFSERKGRFGQRVCGIVVKGKRGELISLINTLVNLCFLPESLQWTELHQMEENDNG